MDQIDYAILHLRDEVDRDAVQYLSQMLEISYGTAYNLVRFGGFKTLDDIHNYSSTTISDLCHIHPVSAAGICAMADILVEGGAE